MLTAARAQRAACPQCTRQVLSLFQAGFSGSHHAFTPQTSSRATRLISQGRSPLRRHFSTTRSALQNAQPEPDRRPDTDIEELPSSPNGDKSHDVETVVRQARQAFGKTLPKGYLSDEEYKLYERLYGPPLRDTLPEDVGYHTREAPSSHEYEDVIDIEQSGKEQGQAEDPVPGAEALNPSLPSEAGQSYVNAVAQNQREYDALMKLQKDFEQYNLENKRPSTNVEAEEQRALEEQEDMIEEEEDEDEIDDDEYLDSDGQGAEEGRIRGRSARLHEYTKLGHWRTSPSTVFLPTEDLVTPIQTLLTRTDTTHIKQTAERAFGGPGLPFSVATPASKRNAPQRGVGLEAGQGRMSEIEADAFIATNYPGMYSTATSILVEVRKRLGPQWLQGLMGRNGGDGPRMLDVGAGGAAAAAWQEVMKAEWQLAKDRGEAAGHSPKGKRTVVVGSDHLRHRISRFLHDTTFLPRLPDYLHSGNHPDKIDDSETPLPRKQFDVIIASHMLLPFKEEYKRKAFIDNLWEMLSPEGGILIVLEKGMPRGFEAVAEVRGRLLNEFIEAPTSDPQVSPDPETPLPERETGSIIAPCTNHKPCPMYLTPGLSPGRKDFCHFSQRFTRPPFLQRVLEAKWRNHEDIDFSFVAVQRGSGSSNTSTTTTADPPTPVAATQHKANDIADRAFQGYEHVNPSAADPSDPAPDARSLPRQILPSLKRTGHVTLDVCTPAGTIERWTIPKSFSKQAYHDARKTRWGDLWALGAKTRVVRNVRLGKAGTITANDGGVRAQRALGGNKKKGGGGGNRRKIPVIELNANESGIFSATEAGVAGRVVDRNERRTKGGKKPRRKQKDLLQELEEME
ncbi:mitochondrial small ribosomal subunit Rsm22-domain-containing protein [Microdochium trichocladiopsis]|uniref:Mitochondrial small ribosomal subunit Rsm22-domain-containing protein n=1 Tax=Microdochium trichocladiopsis TaxID=1682393 RepID=A0A9P8YE18_9PEZI|nr:mitochondrial small ribosomal subunit Rsm22-domain-containing protein [Microdochium trichocladiopsis]KAH7037162.1 mitochondrial small ribosomal subunit Rsm22-domain-containing protein [Microdochium trichocladiopsis]